MDATFASYQARLESFVAPKTKSRRTSTRSKKPAPKASQKVAWPLASPRPEDLAYAGFVFNPTSTSPDNVRCFSCLTQLDGWEETDIPAYEHLTHSPNCGFAMNVCIRLRNGDPGRTEDDPLSDTMLEARRKTFANFWPLDISAGFPGVEQMVQAGWFYDPGFDAPDGVSCPYCCLSLDAWDAGDDPTEEHRKRSEDCLFFALKEFYHPAQKPKPTRGKRASSRSSTASRKGTKTTRTKKGASKEDLDKPLPPAPDETINSFTGSIADSVSVVIPAKAPPAKSRKTKKALAQEEAPLESFTESFAESVATGTIKAPAKGRKTKKAPTSDAVPVESSVMSIADSVVSQSTKAPAKGRKTKKTTKRGSAISVASTTRSTRNNKRASDHFDLEVELEEPKASPKRPRLSDISMPASMLESTPIKTPQAVSQPKAQPTRRRTPSPAPVQPQTPQTPEAGPAAARWEPISVDDFFEKRDIFGAISNVIVDSGLDKENMDVEMGVTPETLARAVKAGLTSPEKKMTIEEWVMYNANRGEEKLRMECERQITAFETEGRRAMAVLEAH